MRDDFGMLGSENLFPPPKTPEQKIDELKAFGDLIENWALPALCCVLRWPWWPLWKRDHGGHESQQFSDINRLWFDWLCVAGLAAQLFCTYYLIAEPLYYRLVVVHQVEGLWSLTAFAALTAIRIGVWFYTEVWQKW